MATLSQLRTDLQYRYRDTAGNFLSSVPANLFINVACEDFCGEVEPQWREYGFYITAKQFAYDLPADLQHTLTMMWYQNGQYEIPYLSPQEFKMRGYFNRRITVSTPQAYTIMDGPTANMTTRQLILGPAPGTSSNTATLNTNMNASVTSMVTTAGGAAQFQSPAGMVLLESEQIQYQSNSATNTLSLLQRGMGGTTAASHLAGVSVPTTIYRLDLVMCYTYQFKYMTLDSDVPNFSSQFHRIPIHYALHLALKSDGRDKQADSELQLYMQKRQEAKRDCRLYTRYRHNKKISSGYS